MQNKKTPFTITERILTDVMEICELVGKVSSTQHLSSDPVLRRQNRIKTIYSSLAIEQNTLSLEQVTAVLSGKRVLAPPKDIAEVKNAYEIYDHLNELNPYSVEDLLLAHHVMMRGLVQEDGVFRSKPVGVVDSHGNVLHFGTLPQYVPPLVEELLKWTEDSPLPMLIKSCVFHYEFEVIHPFADGNGRIGRLWHTRKCIMLSTVMVRLIIIMSVQFNLSTLDIQVYPLARIRSLSLDMNRMDFT